MKQLIRMSFLFVVTMACAVFAQEAPPPPPTPPPGGFMLAFWQYIFPLLMTGVGGLVLWLGKLASAWLKSKVEAMDHSTAAMRFAAAGQQLFELAMNITADLNTRMKPQLVAFMADGVLSDSEKATLKSEARRLLLESVAPQTMAYLKQTLGGAFESVLSGVIERAVVAVKPTDPGPKVEAKADPQTP